MVYMAFDNVWFIWLLIMYGLYGVDNIWFIWRLIMYGLYGV
jgi:hypothetical protein